MAELRANKLGAGSWKQAGSWNSVSCKLGTVMLRARISYELDSELEDFYK